MKQAVNSWPGLSPDEIMQQEIRPLLAMDIIEQLHRQFAFLSGMCVCVCVFAEHLWPSPQFPQFVPIYFFSVLTNILINVHCTDQMKRKKERKTERKKDRLLFYSSFCKPVTSHPAQRVNGSAMSPSAGCGLQVQVSRPIRMSSCPPAVFCFVV